MLTNKLNRIMHSYLSYFHIKDVPFQFILADDMYEAQKNYGFNDAQIRSLDEATSRQNWKHVAACMKFPKHMNEPFTILFKKPYLETIGESELYRLVFHEMTHMVDYVDYARMHHLNSYEELFSDPQTVLFQHWSEYHAERRGYAAWLRHSYGVYLNYPEFKREIMEKETMNNVKYYGEHYTNTAEYGSTRQIYFTMHLLSRLSIWMQILPHQMQDILSREPFNYRGIEWIKRMMYLFQKNPTIDQMDPHFMEIARIIAEGIAIPKDQLWKPASEDHMIPIDSLPPMNLTHNL